MNSNGNGEEKAPDGEIDRGLLVLVLEPFQRFFSALRNLIFCCRSTSSPSSTDLIDGRVTRLWRRWRNQIRSVFGVRRRRRSTHSPRRYQVNAYPRVSLPPANLMREYNMSHDHRGIAVIFNQENFDYETFQSRRVGTHVDLERLTKTLENLDFDVRDFTDLKKEAIIRNLRKVSSMNHRNSDCLLIVILTHGELGRIFSRDEAYAISLVTNFFTDQNCPSLSGKPRLFFIQSCRGEQRDQGFLVETEGHFRLKRQSLGSYEEVDVTTFSSLFPSHHQHEEMVHNPPNHPDFLVVRSTMPNYVSFRNTTRGSWFIEDLCEELDRHACETDLLKLLTVVNYRISLRESVPEGEKQILCISSMLTKLLTFHPKKNSKKNGAR